MDAHTKHDDHDKVVVHGEQLRRMGEQMGELSKLVETVAEQAATVAILKDRSDHSRANVAIWISLICAVITALSLLLQYRQHQLQQSQPSPPTPTRKQP